MGFRSTPAITAERETSQSLHTFGGGFGVAANRAFLVCQYLPRAQLARGVWVRHWNTGFLADNAEAGIYTRDLRKIASVAFITNAPDVYRSLLFPAPVQIGAGKCFAAIVFSTARAWSYIGAGNGPNESFTADNAFPLPNLISNAVDSSALNLHIDVGILF